MPQPDWNKVEWFVYDDPIVMNGDPRPVHRYRVAPRALSPGEMRRSERFVYSVKRCSLATIREHLKRGALPIAIQRVVDDAASDQAERSKPRPNVYRDLIERRKSRGATPKAA